MADGRLVGMLSDRDVRSAVRNSPGSVAGRSMTPDPITVTSEKRIEHAARIMLDGRFGSLPCVDGHLVGNVTYTDLRRAYVHRHADETLQQITVAVTAAG